MIKPNFLLIGAPRSGTTAMYSALKQHPQVFLSVLKEPLFFAIDLSAPPHAIRDRTLYLELFDGAVDARRIGEGSVWYLFSRRAADEIKRLNDDMKLLVMLRNPIEMMSSLHALYLRTGNEDVEDFAAALALEPTRRQGRCLPKRCYFPEGLRYREVASYAEQVERYLQVFPRDALHWVIFDDFVDDKARAYRQVLRFLEVDDRVQAEFADRWAQRKIRQQVLRQLVRVRPEVRRKLRLFNRHHRGPRAPIATAVLQRLAVELRPEVERLSALLGRDLTFWLHP